MHDKVYTEDVQRVAQCYSHASLRVDIRAAQHQMQHAAAPCVRYNQTAGRVIMTGLGNVCKCDDTSKGMTQAMTCRKQCPGPCCAARTATPASRPIVGIHGTTCINSHADHFITSRGSALSFTTSRLCKNAKMLQNTRYACQS